ncbi:beta-propeller fold lactonase family protein [Paucibacter sp. R3-3]|uniref:Beta-propeller fold lactonase family protein n=1 Tax=Roseateles agri TaxID=3098619 RepID=A0ABU5DJ56_9BURK|nr:beta-propeller fold lactonase family protein [Paucibacter sp. R3-3]MDY0745773.1 beta-propeller fold lactonase family protein [Paucibacter sp. R3-3]
MKKYAVYVSNAESGDIAVLRLDDGQLHPLQTVAAGGELMPMARCGERLYVARRSEPREALSFAIGADGTLTQIGAGPLPHSMAYIATDRSGRWLLSASYGGNLVAVNAIDEAGIVGATVQIVPTGPNAHAIQCDASNRQVLATSLGGGVLMRFDFDPASGRLSLRDTVAPHTGASPRHFRFGADGRFVYLLGELDGMIDVLDAATLATLQTASLLTPDFSGEPWAADLQLTPDGRFLYASERRSSLLAGFRIDPASGLLGLIGHTPTEAQPRGFAITPDGGWLLSVGQRSERLRVFAIDAETGALQPTAEAPVGRGANWIEVFPC